MTLKTMPKAGVNGAVWRIYCPECGFEVVDRVLDEDGQAASDDAAVTVVEDRDEYEDGNPLRTRGGYVLVSLCCARGHYFSLVSVNHKGTELIGLVPKSE